MCKEKKKNKLGRRILSVTLTFVMALTLVPTYAVQAETPQATTVQAEKEIITEKVATKDVVYSATPNSPIKLKELQEIDLSEAVSSIAGGTIKLTAEDIDTTDLSGWYVYDHYDTMWYADEDEYVAGTGYNASRRSYFPVTDTYATDTSASTDTTNPTKATIAYWLEKNSTKDDPRLGRLNEHILSDADAMGNASMTFVGYAQSPYVDFLYYPADATGTKNVDFTVDSAKLNTHTLYYAGFLFNTAVDENGKLHGYALILQYTSTTQGNAYIKYLDGVDANSLHNTTGYSYTIPGTDVSGIPSKTFNVATVCDISMTITNNHVKVTTKNTSGEDTAEKVLFDDALPDDTNYGGFGPIVGYTPHSCSQATIYKFSNLKMGIKTSSSIFASYFDADYAQKDKNDVNDKYYVVIGDPAKKDGFDIRNDKEALALLQKEGVVIITNLDIAKSNVGDGLDSVPNYNVSDYLGGNVYKFPNTNNYAINTPEYYQDLKDYIQETVGTEKWKPLTNGETAAIAGNLGTGVEAVKPIPNTQLTYTTRANDETSEQPVTYQIANINADLLDDLPGSSATIKINDDLGYDVANASNVSYALVKPDGTQVALTTNSFTVTKNTTDWPTGQYKVITTFAGGTTSISTFGLTNGLDVNIVNDGINSNLWFDYATTGNNVARTNVDYETKIHAQDGYVLPDSVYIYVDKDRIGGSDLSEFELLDDSQYSYNPQSGVIRVNGAEVTGDIYIIADTRNIKYTLTTEPAVDPSLKVYGNAARTADAIDCFSSYYKNDGKQHNAYLSAPTGYAYPTIDKLVIKATKYKKNVKGNIDRDENGVPKEVMSTKEYKGTSYYNANTGVIKFPKNAYDYDEIEVIAKAEPKVFKVTNKFQAINNTNTADATIIEAKDVNDQSAAAASSVIWHTAYDCILKVRDAEPTYKIAQSSIAVKVGGTLLAIDKWTVTDNQNGTFKVHINENVIEGNVEISANAVKQYDVSAEFIAVTSSDGLTNETSIKLNAQSDYSAVLSVDGSSDHPLSQVVKVQISDGAITPAYTDMDPSKYTYNQETGALTIDRANITHDIKIVANAGNRIYYELDNMHATPEVKGVADNGTLTTTLKVDNDAYMLPESITVYQGDVLVSNNYTYNPSTGELQI
ncbi:MAG: hypothetical protein VZR53_15185, partial [Prevotella sp.]|nr:hypothetical protein [Prevotella sp.]